MRLLLIHISVRDVKINHSVKTKEQEQARKCPWSSAIPWTLHLAAQQHQVDRREPFTPVRASNSLWRLRPKVSIQLIRCDEVGEHWGHCWVGETGTEIRAHFRFHGAQQALGWLTQRDYIYLSGKS